MYKNTEEDSLWRDIFTLGEKKNIGGPPISFTIVYPIILFILWFISASIGWVIIETLFKEKIKK